MHHDPAAALTAAIDAYAQALARQQPGGTGEAVELALVRANAIAAAILAAPATTAEAIRAKAIAVQWELQGEGPGAVLDAHRLDAIRSFVDDVRAMPVLARPGG